MSDFIKFLVFFVLPLIIAYMAKVKTEKCVGKCSTNVAYQQVCPTPPVAAVGSPPPTLSVLISKKCEAKKEKEDLPKSESGPTITEKETLCKEDRKDIISALMKYGLRKSQAIILVEQALQSGCQNREDAFIFCMSNIK